MPRPRATPENLRARILDNVAFEPNSGCWLWLRAVGKHGYGQISVNDVSKRVHRVSYMVFRGPIPAGFVIDHRCRIQSCVNPDHLEPVTIHENTMRGIGVTSQNAKKFYCKRGHELPFAKPNKNGRLVRRCGQCDRDHAKNTYIRRKVPDENGLTYFERRRIRLMELRRHVTAMLRDGI